MRRFRAPRVGSSSCCTAARSLSPGHSSPGSRSSSTPAPGWTSVPPTPATTDPRRTVDSGMRWIAASCIRAGTSFFGPPAPEMFAELSSTDIRALLVDALQWWLARPAPSGYEPAPGADDAVLGACRSLVRFRHDVWLSKDAAGRRLRDTGTASELIDRCLRARLGGPPPRVRRRAPSSSTSSTKYLLRLGPRPQPPAEVLTRSGLSLNAPRAE